MEGVGDTRGQILARECRAKAGNIEVSHLRIATALSQNGLDEFLAAGMVNEFRLQRGKNLHAAFHRHTLVESTRVEGVKCLLYQLASELAKFRGIRRGSVD